MKKKFIKYLGMPLFVLAVLPHALFAEQTSSATAPAGSMVSNGPISYLIGGVIALLIMGYLIYSLIRPDKF